MFSHVLFVIALFEVYMSENFIANLYFNIIYLRNKKNLITHYLEEEKI